MTLINQDDFQAVHLTLLSIMKKESKEEKGYAL